MANLSEDRSGPASAIGRPESGHDSLLGSKISNHPAVYSINTNIHTITRGQTDVTVARNPDDEE